MKAQQRMKAFLNRIEDGKWSEGKWEENQMSLWLLTKRGKLDLDFHIVPCRAISQSGKKQFAWKIAACRVVHRPCWSQCLLYECKCLSFEQIESQCESWVTFFILFIFWTNEFEKKKLTLTAKAMADQQDITKCMSVYAKEKCIDNLLGWCGKQGRPSRTLKTWVTLRITPRHDPLFLAKNKSTHTSELTDTQHICTQKPSAQTKIPV